jgi:transposase InsO family protein
MDEKVMFIADCLRDEEPMTVLCERYGISRETGYVWRRRYQAAGVAGLEELSRAPHRHGASTPADLVVRIIEARKRRPYWGPKKLLAVLAREDASAAWPSASTVAEILRREGLSEPRRRRRRLLTVDRPFAEIAAANDAWCIDFKGWFRTGDGRRCDPLTVTDAFSRYLLGLEIVAPVTEAVEPVMDRLFCEHGLPQAIRSDNGPMGEDGHSAGADLSGQATAEWPPRAHARHAEGADLRSAGGDGHGPAGALRPVPGRVQ